MAVGPHERTSQDAPAPESAAPLSLIFGLVAVVGGVVLFGSLSLLAIPILLVSAIAGLVFARRARGSNPRNARRSWPGRGMALAGAVLSWIALVILAVVVAFTIVLMIVLSGGP